MSQRIVKSAVDAFFARRRQLTARRRASRTRLTAAFLSHMQSEENHVFLSLRSLSAIHFSILQWKSNTPVNLIKEPNVTNVSPFLGIGTSIFVWRMKTSRLQHESLSGSSLVKRLPVTLRSLSKSRQALKQGQVPRRRHYNKTGKLEQK